MKDTDQKFSIVTIGLHWLLAGGMIFMLGLGLYFEQLPEGPELYDAVLLHKSIGVIILGLGALRVVWRLINGFPKPVGNHKGWEIVSAKLAHWFLLLAVVAMPVSGMLMSRGAGYPVAVFGFEVMGKVEKNKALMDAMHETHEILAFVIMAILALHVAGALKHHVIDKDGTLRRMLGGKV